MWLRQFAGHGLVIREDDKIIAYLLGVVTADGIGYVHLVAVHRAYRGRGHGRALWESFAERARAAGARELQAITTPANAGSILFHTSLGMTAEEIPDYRGEGQPRVLFRRALLST